MAASVLTDDQPGSGGSSGGDTGAEQVTRWMAASIGNVRSGPGLGYSVVTTMRQGTEVRGTWTSNGWLDIGGGKFIAGSILTATDPGAGGGGGSSTVPAPTPLRQQILDEAAKYIGTRYTYGGNSPAEGFDCSGYTKYVFAQLGITTPRTAAQQQAWATPVSNPQPGDLVFFGYPAYHVGIYAGNGMMYDTGRPGVPTAYRAIFSGVSGYGQVLGVN